jgi:hypothetical protein
MKKNSQYLEEILESIEIKKKLIGLNKEVFLSIKKIFLQLKIEVKFLFVEMEVQQQTRSIFLQNF